MARAKKNGHFLNCKVHDDILERLNMYSNETKLPKTAVVELALKEYLDKREEIKEKSHADSRP